MVKGREHQICLDKGPLASERVPVFKFWLCPGPLVLWGLGVGVDFGSGREQLEVKVPSSTHASTT